MARNGKMSRSRATTYQASTSAGVQEDDAEFIPFDVVEEAPTPRGKPKGRGPTKTRQPPKDDEEKPLVWPAGPKEIHTTGRKGQLMSTYRLLIEQHMGDQPSLTFNGIDHTKKHAIYLDFLTRYQWASWVVDIPAARGILENCANKMWSNVTSTLRNKLIDSTKSKKPADWRNHAPLWCLNQQRWDKYLALWSQENWQDMCRQNKKNRGMSKVVHHLGSKSLKLTAADMEKENGGRPPSPTSLFLRSRLGEKKCKELESTLQVHDQSSDDSEQTSRPITCNDIDAIEFRDKKSSDALKNYLELRNNSEYESVPDDLLFQQASGPTSHHKPYGLGNTSMKQRKSTLRSRSAIYVGPDSSSNTRHTEKMFSSEEVDEIVRAATLASNMEVDKKLASMNNEIMDRVAAEINKFCKTAGIPQTNLSLFVGTSIHYILNLPINHKFLSSIPTSLFSCQVNRVISLVLKLQRYRGECIARGARG